MVNLNKTSQVEYLGAFADMKNAPASAIKKSDTAATTNSAPVLNSDVATVPEAAKSDAKAAAEKPLSGF